MNIYSIHNITNFLSPFMHKLHFLPSGFFHKPESNSIFLLYHSVSKELKSEKKHYFTVSLQTFHSQMKFLYENHYHVISINEWDNEGQIQKKSRRTVVLTFDDGYKNNFYYVCPILKKYGFKATFFPICNYIDQHQKFPWLKEPSFPLNSNYPLKSGQICQMDEEGMEIGSHALSHTKLTQLSEQDSWKEIKESKECLENILGHPISSFSYPYGAWFDFNASHKLMVKRAGYKTAVTSIYGSNSYRADKIMLKRIPISNQDTQKSFAMKVEGYYNWIGKFQWFLSNIRHPIKNQA